ncbi:MAG: phosphotyrosine protein phosphatase [Pseudomonadota bacterium]
MTRVLFLCGKARQRSPTAADVAMGFDGVEADFAGLSADADELVSAEQIDWADVIAVMERRQVKRLKQQFGTRLKAQRVVCLDVPDRYAFGDPALVSLLEGKLRRVLTRA